MLCKSKGFPWKNICKYTLIALLTAGITCATSLPNPAIAITAAEKAAEAESALTQLTAMQKTLEEASATYYEALAAYQEAVELRDATARRIDEISVQIQDIQSRLSSRARDMYRKGNTSFVDMLLGAASFDELALNWDLLNRVNETDADLSVRAKNLRSEEVSQKALYAQQVKLTEEKSNAAAKAYSDAEALVATMQATYDALSAEAQQLYAEEQAAAAAYQTGGVVNDDGSVTDIQTGQVYSSAAEYSAVTGNAIVDRAYAMLGKGYEYAGTGKNGKFDCSGLVGYAITGTYNRLGNTTTFLGYNKVSDPQPGDICVSDGHTGIYIGNGQMIHAADEATGVVIGPVQNGMIYVRY